MEKEEHAIETEWHKWRTNKDERDEQVTNERKTEREK